MSRQLSLRARIRYDERVVWSPECGGCLMFQRRTKDGWVDWNSACEGEFPTNDASAKRAVAQTLRNMRAAELVRRAEEHERHAAALRSYAETIKAGGTKRDWRLYNGMTAYERAERSGDAY